MQKYADEAPGSTAVDERSRVRLPATQRFPLPLDYIENADGTYDILNVAVLYPVKRDDFDCTLEWMQEAVRQMRSDFAENKYRPVVKIGHVGKPRDGEPERPTTGAFAANPRMMNDVLYVDYVGLNRADFQALREGRFPYPSIEAIPSKHRITAISQLGCTLSQLKLPPVKFEADDATVQFSADGLVAFNGNGGSAMELDVNELAQAIAQAVVALIQGKNQQGGTAVTNNAQQATGNQSQPAGQAAQVPSGAAPNAQTATQSGQGGATPPAPPAAPAGQPAAQAGGTNQQPPKGPPAKGQEPPKKEKTEMATNDSVRTFADGTDPIPNSPTVEKKVGQNGAEEANTEAKGGGSGETKEVKAAAIQQAEASFRAYCVGLSHAGVVGMNNDAIEGHVRTMMALFAAGDEAGLHRYQAQIARGEKVALGQRMGGGATGNPPGSPSLSLFNQPQAATVELAAEATAALAGDPRTRTMLNRRFGLNMADPQSRAAVQMGMLCQDGTDVVKLDI